ncbi:MAG TPA: IBR domain-containing protein [Candidatus Micrarchaeia archaeon]|nr:IBR domain-containing protein [Candidatus Micrarchaeia archaeon]
MAGSRQLVCPHGCRPARFELIGGAVFVDAAGAYAGHRDGRASFRCEVCQTVAIDLRAAQRAMRRERRQADPEALRCPGCGGWLLAPEDDPAAVVMECPTCGTRFEREEGMPSLGGTGTVPDEDNEAGDDDPADAER